MSKLKPKYFLSCHQKIIEGLKEMHLRTMAYIGGGHWAMAPPFPQWHFEKSWQFSRRCGCTAFNIRPPIETTGFLRNFSCPNSLIPPMNCIHSKFHQNRSIGSLDMEGGSQRPPPGGIKISKYEKWTLEFYLIINNQHSFQISSKSAH